MVDTDRWLLPEGIEELLPPEAERLERVRRRLLELYRTWGYRQVIPPFIEYLDSLLTGAGNDLDLETFKLTDQLSGRLMGVRADMTPQVARIDASQLQREEPTRLCYLGTVLRTRPASHGGTRSPMQVGVELYGHAGPESDREVLALMVETLLEAGLGRVYLDLGHVGIFRGLARRAGLDADTENRLFDALQRKAKPEITEILATAELEKTAADALLALADLNGGPEILEEAREALAGAGDEVNAALDNLRRVAGAVGQRAEVSVHFDLAELRGYHYHTGVVFAAFVPGRGQAIAQGGRYDGIARVFGRDRPATGFSADLREVLSLASDDSGPIRGIFAPCADDAALDAAIAELRRNGERVVQALPGQQGAAADMDCDRQLAEREGRWQVEGL
ncbi:ATP phosphoribosyltransferase regulatory subunit [Thiohalomonas denitrificans]|uniref:ATP phosphoribosyltransferase regulatory subunit n=1 Tax=Thiohalomonas denitrificans TaxID=415747 RepID=A0A1G5PJW8_9GAMM|nr:ATP phosphoribosyltransferase regulatory subunit [Thiohalomonas denitrificans]SCZ49805.1 ATP phosphoribosyltransferase regulatory subunit [Thiohalomonas denitrificans]